MRIDSKIVSICILSAGIMKERRPGSDPSKIFPTIIQGGGRDGEEVVIMDDMILWRNVAGRWVEYKANRGGMKRRNAKVLAAS